MQLLFAKTQKFLNGQPHIRRCENENLAPRENMFLSASYSGHNVFTDITAIEYFGDHWDVSIFIRWLCYQTL